jgi:hypothetical protein
MRACDGVSSTIAAVKNIFVRWLVFLSLFAVIGEPLVADAHLMLDPATGAEICSASHVTLGRHSHAPTDRSAHQHDCCVAMASFAKTGASSFAWQPEPLSFSAPQWRGLPEQPALAWQLRRSRAPPQVLI